MTDDQDHIDARVRAALGALPEDAAAPARTVAALAAARRRPAPGLGWALGGSALAAAAGFAVALGRGPVGLETATLFLGVL